MLKTFLIPKPSKVTKTYLLGCDDITIWPVFINRPGTVIGHTTVYVVPKEATISQFHYELYTMDDRTNYIVTSTPIYLSNFHCNESASGVEFNLNLGAVNFSTHKVWVLFEGAAAHYDGTTFIPRLDHQIYEFTSSTDFDNMEYTSGSEEIVTMGYIPLHLGGSYWYFTVEVDENSPISDLGPKTCSVAISNTSYIGSKVLSDYIDENSEDQDNWSVICVKDINDKGNGTIEIRIPYEDTKPEIYGTLQPTDEGLEYVCYFYNDLDQATTTTAFDYYEIDINSDIITINNGKAPAMQSDSRGPLYE